MSTTICAYPPYLIMSNKPPGPGRPRKSARPIPEWARRITESRNKKSLNQMDLAEAIGVNQKTLSDYETGKTEPSLSTFDAIAKETGVNAVWLVYGWNPDNSDTNEGISIRRHKNNRLFGWTLYQVVHFLSQEGFEGDVAYLDSYTEKLFRAAKGAANEIEAKERILAAIEVERVKLRN